MGIPVRELQDRVSSRDFALYRAYDNIDPIGMTRFDMGVGIICKIMAQINGSKGVKVSDFMPDYTGTLRPKKTPDQMWATMKMFTQAAGGEVK